MLHGKGDCPEALPRKPDAKRQRHDSDKTSTSTANVNDAILDPTTLKAPYADRCAAAEAHDRQNVHAAVNKRAQRSSSPHLVPACESNSRRNVNSLQLLPSQCAPPSASDQFNAESDPALP